MCISHPAIDNDYSQERAAFMRWLAARRCGHVYCTPTRSFWLLHLDRWCGLLAHRAIRRTSRRNVDQLVRRIRGVVKAYN